MNARILLLLAFGVVASVTSVARAGVDVGISAEIRLGHALPPPPPDVIVVEHVGPPGAPPWAASRWYRRNHAYYYYPGYDVYYRPDTRVWFYLDGGSWRRNGRLPDSIRVDFDRAVSLSLETDKPYAYHPDIVRYYPSSYFTKVKFRDSPAGPPASPGHVNGIDKEKGKGKGHAKNKHHP